MLRQFSREVDDRVSTLSTTDLARLIPGYRLYARTEGKSDKTIAIVANSVGYLEGFLRSEGLATDVTRIGSAEIRAFILHLQGKKRFSGHPFNKTQDRCLSGHMRISVKSATLTEQIGHPLAGSGWGGVEQRQV